jgi:hypothetical protein
MFIEIRQETAAALPPTRSINENGVKVAIVIAAFWAIATASVAMRFYARHIKGGLYVLEDWLIMGALVGFPHSPSANGTKSISSSRFTALEPGTCWQLPSVAVVIMSCS